MSDVCIGPYLHSLLPIHDYTITPSFQRLVSATKPNVLKEMSVFKSAGFAMAAQVSTEIFCCYCLFIVRACHARSFASLHNCSLTWVFSLL